MISRYACYLLVLLVVAGCSSDGRKPEYYESVESKPLIIPEDFDRPSSSNALVIRAPAVPLSSFALDSVPPRISSTTSGIDANSRLSWSAQGMYLLVEDMFESAERRLDIVISRSGMQNIRQDEQGVHRFDYYQKFDDIKGGFFSSLAFWRKDKREDYSGAYQVYIRPDGENTRVYIKYADGTDCEPDAAEHVLAVLRARLG
ncbi:MAG: hypothetical protein V3R56_05970 [Xanthomonadales bacterium]